MKIISTFLILILGSFQTSANSIKDSEFKWKQVSGEITLFFESPLTQLPELKIVGQDIEIELQKKDQLKTPYYWSGNSLNLKAETDKIHVQTPFDLKRHQGKVLLELKKDSLQILFPKLKAIAEQPSDEQFLENLEQEQKATAAPEAVLTDSKPTSLFEKSADEKPKSELTHLMSKFVGVLVLVLGLFFGVVAVMKKFALKRSKIGSLKDQSSIEVIQTTHLSPKESLLLVKAHDKVLLIGRTESGGLQMLTEMDSVAEILKESEKNATGKNFDDSLSKANSLKNLSLPLKKNPYETRGKISRSPQASLSQEIRSRIQSLRPGQ